MEKTTQHIVWIKICHGVTDELEYTVSVNGKIEDIGLWRTVINGYPYKSLEELGVADIDEAFTATKQAVYCYLYENTPEDYEAIGEAGERTLNALKQIVSNAQNSTETPSIPKVNITPEHEEWIEDEYDKNFVSKIYYIKSDTKHIGYRISFGEEKIEGCKITNINGEEKDNFENGEKFKIMIPKDNEGTFSLNIKTELETKPVLYGGSPNIEWQNYALTAYMYEDAVSTYSDFYEKPEEPEIPEIPETPEKPSKPEKPKEPKKTKEEPTKEEVKILPVTGM